MSSNDISIGLDARPVEASGPFRYRSSRWVRAEANVGQIVPTRAHVLWSLVLPVAGAGSFVFGSYALVTKMMNPEASWALAVAGLLAMSLGAILCWSRIGRVTFDLRRREYWTNHRFDGPRLFGRFRGRIDTIAALQLCRGAHLAGRGRFFWWCQLNLVLNEPRGKRMALMGHGAVEQVRDDAEALADFLGVSLLDHTTARPDQAPGADTFARIFGPKAKASPANKDLPDVFDTSESREPPGIENSLVQPDIFSDYGK